MVGRRLFAMIALCVSLWSFGVTVRTSVGELRRVVDRVRSFSALGLWDSRTLAYGEPFTSFLRAAADRLRTDESYLLAPGPPGSQGSDLVRFHLLPRIARRYGAFRSPAPPAWIIWVARDGEAPALERTSEDVAWSMSFRPGGGGGADDERILASIDVPPEKAVAVDAHLTVQGWCQELGGKPCPGILLMLNGQPQRMVAERYPRPDVERAISGIGDCARAGYRFHVDLSGLHSGGHLIEVYFTTADGRHRRLQRSFGR